MVWYCMNVVPRSSWTLLGDSTSTISTGFSKVRRPLMVVKLGPQPGIEVGTPGMDLDALIAREGPTPRAAQLGADIQTDAMVLRLRAAHSVDITVAPLPALARGL